MGMAPVDGAPDEEAPDVALGEDAVDLGQFPKWEGPGVGGGRPEPIPAKGLVAFMESTDRGSQAIARAKGREWLPVTPGRGWILNEGEFLIRAVDGEDRVTWNDTMAMVRTVEFDRKAREEQKRVALANRARLFRSDEDAQDQGQLSTLTYNVSQTNTAE